MRILDSARDSARVWRRVLGILVNAAFAIGVLVFVAFYTDNMSIFQKIVVLVVALILYASARAIIHIAIRD